MNTLSDRAIKQVEFIYLKYKTLYGFPQGKCGPLAQEIQSYIGGELVAGYLDLPGRSMEHWWLQVDGVIVDPMSDELQLTDPHTHYEVHRDISKKYWL